MLYRSDHRRLLEVIRETIVHPIDWLVVDLGDLDDLDWWWAGSLHRHPGQYLLDADLGEKPRPMIATNICIAIWSFPHHLMKSHPFDPSYTNPFAKSCHINNSRGLWFLLTLSCFVCVSMYVCVCDCVCLWSCICLYMLF